MLEWSVLRGTSYFCHQPSEPSPFLPPSRMGSAPLLLLLSSSSLSAAGAGSARALPLAEGDRPLVEWPLAAGVRWRTVLA